MAALGLCHAGIRARTLDIAALQNADGTCIRLDLPAAGASVAAKLGQGPQARLAGKQVHRIAASLTFADHVLIFPADSHWPGKFEDSMRYSRFLLGGGCTKATGKEQNAAACFFCRTDGPFLRRDQPEKVITVSRYLPQGAIGGRHTLYTRA
jgi:hypothetical protein